MKCLMFWLVCLKNIDLLWLTLSFFFLCVTTWHCGVTSMCMSLCDNTNKQVAPTLQRSVVSVATFKQSRIEVFVHLLTCFFLCVCVCSFSVHRDRRCSKQYCTSGMNCCRNRCTSQKNKKNKIWREFYAHRKQFYFIYCGVFWHSAAECDYPEELHAVHSGFACLEVLAEGYRALGYQKSNGFIFLPNITIFQIFPHFYLFCSPFLLCCGRLNDRSLINILLVTFEVLFHCRPCIFSTTHVDGAVCCLLYVTVCGFGFVTWRFSKKHSCWVEMNEIKLL